MQSQPRTARPPGTVGRNDCIGRDGQKTKQEKLIFIYAILSPRKHADLIDINAHISVKLVSLDFQLREARALIGTAG